MRSVVFIVRTSPREAAILFLFPLLVLWVGLTGAYAARRQIRLGAGSWSEAYLPGVVLFVLAVPAPVFAYLAWLEPDWLVAPLVLDGQRPPVWALLLLGSVGLLCAGGGYLLGDWLIRRQRHRHLLAGMGGMALLVAAALWQALDSLPQAKVVSPLETLFAFAVPAFLGGWFFLMGLYELEGRKLRRAHQGLSRLAMEKGIAPLSKTRSMHKEIPALALGSQVLPPRGPVRPADDDPGHKARP